MPARKPASILLKGSKLVSVDQDPVSPKPSGSRLTCGVGLSSCKCRFWRPAKFANMSAAALNLSVCQQMLGLHVSSKLLKLSQFRLPLKQCCLMCKTSRDGRPSRLTPASRYDILQRLQRLDDFSIVAPFAQVNACIDSQRELEYD